jgi:hypothetical protein
MTPKSSAANAAARRFWARAVGDATAPEKVSAAAERMCTQLQVGLGRWIGGDGYRALLGRALRSTRAEHPTLGAISCLGGDAPATTAAVRAEGAAELGAGLVALVAEVIELLGRIIGDEMALRLVDQIGMPSPRAVLSTKTEGEA